MLGVVSIAGCGPQRVSTAVPSGQSTVVLLPDPDDGAVGRAVVSNSVGATELVAARESTTINPNQAPAPVTVISEADVTRLYGDVLSTLPAAPQIFLLYFRFESEELTDESRALLPQILQAVRNRPFPDVAVVGHTDTTGTNAGNYELGLRRANAIRGRLLEAGIDAADRSQLARGIRSPREDGGRSGGTAQSPRRNHGPMTLRPDRLVLVCGLVPALITAWLSLYRPSVLSTFEFAAYDRVVGAVSTRPPSGRIAIVDVDERSLSAIGQWPWRRDVIATLITRLRDLGAATVALDIIFAESDRYNGNGVSADQALADTLRAGGVALGYALTFGASSDQSTACVQHPLGIALIHPGDEHADEAFFHATGAVQPSDVAQAAGASGFLNARRIRTGVSGARASTPRTQRPRSAFARARVIYCTNVRDISLRVLNVNATSLILDGRRVPLDGKSNLLLRYRGARHAPSLRFSRRCAQRSNRTADS
jgi:outer membrane protein OmpA-like peptidoglycan-associated protein